MTRRLTVLIACLLTGALLAAQSYSVTIGSVTKSFTSLAELKAFVAAYEEPAPVPDPTPQAWPPSAPTSPLEVYPERRVLKTSTYRLLAGITPTDPAVTSVSLTFQHPRAVAPGIYRFDHRLTVSGATGGTYEGLKLTVANKVADVWMPTYIAGLRAGSRADPIHLDGQEFWTPFYLDTRDTPTGQYAITMEAPVRRADGFVVNSRYIWQLTVGRVDGPRRAEGWGNLSKPDPRERSSYYQGAVLANTREFLTDSLLPLTIYAHARDGRSLLVRVLHNGVVIHERTVLSGTAATKFSLPHPDVKVGDVLTAWVFDASEPAFGSALVTSSVTVQ